MDRLAAFFHWNDLQSLDQAVMVATRQKISLAKLEAWAKREGAGDKLGKFKQQLCKRLPDFCARLSDESDALWLAAPRATPGPSTINLTGSEAVLAASPRKVVAPGTAA